MFIDESLYIKINIFNDTASRYEAAVHLLPAENYLKEFCNFYEVNTGTQKPLPYQGSFHEALKEVCGDDVYKPLAEKAESLFGVPKRVMMFEDIGKLTDEMGGCDGAAPFYIVFDFMFCEYDNFTLCFISGTNN